MHYLQGTKNQGLKFKPSEVMELDLYVDVDFAGLWNYKHNQDPVCVKTCTGFVTTLGSCLVIWSLNLLTKIALNMLQAEYIALSMTMHELVALQRLLKMNLERRPTKTLQSQQWYTLPCLKTTMER